MNDQPRQLTEWERTKALWAAQQRAQLAQWVLLKDDRR